MKLFHASTCIIDKPDIFHSRDKLDFGRGFYLTTIYEQAVKYAERFTRRDIHAFINEYQLDDDISPFTIKTFPRYDSEWLDYVAICRKGLQDNSIYDAVSGGIANDKVFNTIDLYFTGMISKEEALGRLVYIRPNHQLCILNNELLNLHLHFVNAIELDGSE